MIRCTPVLFSIDTYNCRALQLNRQRLQSALDYRSPVEFESAWRTHHFTHSHSTFSKKDYIGASQTNIKKVGADRLMVVSFYRDKRRIAKHRDFLT
jgi:hypothetical protein